MSHNLPRLAVVSLVFLVLAGSSDAQVRRPRRPAPRTEIYTIKGEPAKIDASPKEAKPESYGYTIESWNAVITVNKDGSSVERTEITERFDSKASLNTFGKFRVDFNGDLSDLSISEAYYTKPDGTRKDFSPTAFTVKLTPQAEAAPSFSSLKMLQVDLSETQPGDRIHYVSTKTDRRNYFDGKFDEFVFFPNVVNWRTAEIDLTAPLDYPLQVQAVDLEGEKLADTSDGRAHWHWSLKERNAIEPGEFLNDQIGSSPKLAVTSFKDYAELGRAYWAEAEKKAVVTPEIQQLADSITKDAKTPEQQAYEIYNWVNKNIRYLSIVLDRGGWVPHSSTEIVANRYGDCKDYSTILNTLLKAKNIESYPVLIRSDFTSWFPSVAVPAYFNHAILYIPSLDVFADATSPNTRLGLIPQTIAGKKAFLGGTKVGVIQTPSDRPDDNQVLSNIDLNVLPDGSVKAISRNSYVGRSEILFRSMFSESEIRNNSEMFVAVLLHYFGQEGSGKVLKIGDPFKVNEPFNVDIEIDLNHNTDLRPNGAFTIPIALDLNNPLSFEALIAAEKRATDLSFGAMRLREDYLVSFPEGVTPQAPQGFDYSNDIGSYTKQFQIENGKIRVVRELVVKKDVIPAAEYHLLRELVRKLVDNYNAEIKYTSNAPALPSKTVAKVTNPFRQTAPVFTLPGFGDNKPLTPVKAAGLEASLIKQPNDLEAHKELLIYYSNTKIKDNPARLKARIRHYTWIVEHYPDMSEIGMLGPVGLDMTVASEEFKALWPVWTGAIDKNKNNAAVRLNAFEYAKHFDTQIVEQLMIDGMKLDPNNCEFPLKLSQFFSKPEDPAKPEPAADKTSRVAKELKYGKMALDLLKTERSSERTYKRVGLLQDLARAAYDAGDLAAAKRFATELILDFGQDNDTAYYDSASHIGNIVLGRVALKEKNVAKAGEYLLIAIKAPLRKETSWLPEIDTDLARELLTAGQKDVVLEYLKLCEGLSNLKREKTLFADTIRSLKKWQVQIAAGQTPSWDFYRP